jgi:acyl-CoA thioester hydrolase
MPYFDLARTEYHRHLGRVALPHADFAMRAMSVEYHAPARFDDLLEVFVRCERIGRTSVTFDHAAFRVDDDGTDVLMVTAKQTLVLISVDERKAVPVPDAYRDRIAEFEGVPV